jgi:hypothetical protein
MTAEELLMNKVLHSSQHLYKISAYIFFKEITIKVKQILKYCINYFCTNFIYVKHEVKRLVTCLLLFLKEESKLFIYLSC